MGDVFYAEDINKQQWDEDVVQSMEELCLLHFRSSSSRTNNNNNLIQADWAAGTCPYPWCSWGRCHKTYSEYKLPSPN